MIADALGVTLNLSESKRIEGGAAAPLCHLFLREIVPPILNLSLSPPARALATARQSPHRIFIGGAALTQRLLAFARRQELQIQPVDMAALVKGMTDLLERSIGAGVELLIDVPRGLPSALIDSNQVELALLNLAVTLGTLCQAAGGYR